MKTYILIVVLFVVLAAGEVGLYFYKPNPDINPPRYTSETVAYSGSEDGAVPLKIKSITSSVSPGDNVTIVAETLPGLECQVWLDFSSLTSDTKPYSLVSIISDSKGIATFSLLVNKGMMPGYARVEITAIRRRPAPSTNDYTSVKTSFLVH